MMAATLMVSKTFFSWYTEPCALQDWFATKFILSLKRNETYDPDDFGIPWKELQSRFTQLFQTSEEIYSFRRLRLPDLVKESKYDVSSLNAIYADLESGADSLWLPPLHNLTKLDTRRNIKSSNYVRNLYEEMRNIKYETSVLLSEIRCDSSNMTDVKPTVNKIIENKIGQVIFWMQEDIQILLDLFLLKPSRSTAAAIVDGILNPFSVSEKLSLSWLTEVLKLRMQHVTLEILKAFARRVDFALFMKRLLNTAIGHLSGDVDGMQLADLLVKNLKEERIPHTIIRVLQLMNTSVDCCISIEYFIFKIWCLDNLNYFSQNEMANVSDDLVTTLVKFFGKTPCEYFTQLIGRKWIQELCVKTVPALIEPDIDKVAYIPLNLEEIREISVLLSLHSPLRQKRTNNKFLCEIVGVSNNVVVHVEETPEKSGRIKILQNLDELSVLERRVYEVFGRESLLQHKATALDARRAEMINLSEELKEMRSQGYICYSYISQLEAHLIHCYKVYLRLHKTIRSQDL